MIKKEICSCGIGPPTHKHNQPDELFLSGQVAKFRQQRDALLKATKEYIFRPYGHHQICSGAKVGCMNLSHKLAKIIESIEESK